VFQHKPVSKTLDVAHLSQEAFDEVYQSEVQMGASPTFATLLLLPFERRDGLSHDGLAVPLRFEVWVGAKRANPDTRHLAVTCTLSSLVADLGGVSEHSCWSPFASQSDIEVRVAHPDRLTSIIVPPALPLEDVTPWRCAPKLSRDLLRGFVNSSVSRGFQVRCFFLCTPARGANNSARAQTPTRDSPMDFIEFREEMAEMPVNLLLPCLFVEEAERNLEVVVHKTPKLWANDKEKVLKLMKQGSSGTFEMMPKDDEALRKYDKACADAVKAAKERALDMRRTAGFYREQWERLVTGKVAARPKASVRHSKPIDLDALGAIGSPPPSASPPMHGGSVSTEVRAQSDGGTEYVLPLPLHATDGGSIGDSFDSGHGSARPAAFLKQDSNLSLASTASMSAAAAATSPSQAEVDEEELSEERQWELRRAKGGVQQVSFRPSTSRKDAQLRFVPINLHLQVLTVRDAKIDLKPKAVGEVAAPKKQTVFTKVRQSIVQSTAFARSSPGKAQSSGHSAQSAGLVALAEGDDEPHAMPPIDIRDNGGGGAGADDFDGVGGGGSVLASSGRRRGRQSIVASVLGESSAGTPTYAPRATTASTLPNIGEADDGLPFWDDDPHILYETLSVGAPSAHAMRTPGLTIMREELSKAKHEAERLKDEPTSSGASLAQRLEAYRKYHEMRLLFTERMDIVLCQALTSVVASIVARLFVMAATGGTEDEDEQALQLIQHGFLVGWESLLSTHGSEIAMLSDTKFAVRYITDNVTVRLELLPDDVELKTADVRLYRSSRACAAGTLSAGGLDDACALVVAIRLPDKVVDELPRPLRSYVEDSTAYVPPEGVVDFEACKQRQIVPLSLTCVLFTQGINEMQSLANLWGSQGSWQEDINKESSELIYQFISRRFGDDSGERSEQQEKTRQLTLMALAKLRRAMKNQANVEKNYEILTSSADLVRWLGGIRICSCKSAKDRTAMSLTLEEARLLFELHHVATQPMDLANIMREHGTRLVNVNKNTGVPKYAFNMAQRKLLPEQYRPPTNVIGGFFRGNVT